MSSTNNIIALINRAVSACKIKFEHGVRSGIKVVEEIRKASKREHNYSLIAKNNLLKAALDGKPITFKTIIKEYFEAIREYEDGQK